MYTFLKNIFLFETFHIYKTKVKLGHTIYNNVENASYKGNILADYLQKEGVYFKPSFMT